MKKLLLLLLLAFGLISSTYATAHTQLFEEGMAAYKEGNYEKALSRFELDASTGDYEGNSNLMLGYMYIEGQGTQKDIGKGINYFASSAEKGSAGGYFALGSIYLELFRDYSCAFPLYEKSVVILNSEASSLPTGIFISQEDKNKRERVIKSIAAFKEKLNHLINLQEPHLPLGFT